MLYPIAEKPAARAPAWYSDVESAYPISDNSMAAPTRRRPALLMGLACSVAVVVGLVMSSGTADRSTQFVVSSTTATGPSQLKSGVYSYPRASVADPRVQVAARASAQNSEFEAPIQVPVLRPVQVTTLVPSTTQSSWAAYYGGLALVPLTFVVLYLTRKSAPKEPLLVRYSGSEEMEQEKKNKKSRWEGLPPPPHPSATKDEEAQKTFRTAVVQWLMSYKKAAFGETEEDSETLNVIGEPGEMQKEYLVIAPPHAWDPAVVSDPVSAARPVQADELANDKLLGMLLQKRDEELNILAWKCLGYQYIALGSGYAWDTSGVFPKWRVKYPIPPDLTGISGYKPETIEAVEFLVKTTAEEYHDALERYSKSLGLRYSPKYVGPTAMRKAQVTQWLMFYREELFGVPMDELLERKQARVQEAKKERMRVLKERANALGVTLEEVLEREEKKKKRQRMEKIRRSREKGEMPPRGQPTSSPF